MLEAAVRTPYATTSRQERALKLTFEASSLSLTTLTAPLGAVFICGMLML